MEANKELKEVASYVDKAVLRINKAIPNPHFQSQYDKASKMGQKHVDLLMLGFLDEDMSSIQARWGDVGLNKILVMSTYIIANAEDTTESTLSVVRKFWV